MEIERKYLLNKIGLDLFLNERTDVLGKNIEQYYIPNELKPKILNLPELSKKIKIFLETENKYRIRSSFQTAFSNKKEYELTYKSSGNLVREEVNEPLSEKEYNLLAKLLIDNNIIPIKKYRIVKESDYKNILFEIDLYLNKKIDGLVVCEVELPYADYYFKKPNWLGKEITFLKEFSNENLSNYINGKEYKTSDIEQLLEFFNISTNNVSNKTIIPFKKHVIELINKLVSVKTKKGEISIHDISEQNDKNIIFFNNNVNINNNELTYDKVFKIVNILANKDLCHIIKEICLNNDHTNVKKKKFQI